MTLASVSFYFRPSKLCKRTRNRRQNPNCRDAVDSGRTNEKLSLKWITTYINMCTLVHNRLILLLLLLLLLTYEGRSIN